MPTVIPEETFLEKNPKTFPRKRKSANAKFFFKTLHVLILSVIRMVVYRFWWDLHRGGRRQRSSHFFAGLFARSPHVLGTLSTTS